MKTIRLKLLTLMSVLGCVLSITSQAEDFEYNGLYYNFVSKADCTVELTFPYRIHALDRVYKRLKIPPKAIYDSTSYSVIAIGDWAFHEWEITSVDIPNSVTTIGNEAFFPVEGLTSVNIPSSVTTIGKNAFSRSSLSVINVEDNNLFYGSIDGILYSKENGIMTTLIMCPGAKEGIIRIPSSVTTIVSDAFFGCSELSSVEIPNSVTSIGTGAFRDSGLTSVEIPNSITTIEASVFSNCTKLTNVVIPNSVTTIGYHAFYGSWLLSVEIPNSVTTIGAGAFESCTHLTNVVIPNSVTTIGNKAFYRCYELTSVKIPNSVTTIGYEAFDDCQDIKSVDIPSSVTTIGDDAFGSLRVGCKVYCHWEKPIEITPFVFNYPYELTLYVPIGTKANYEKVEPWCKFLNIVEGDYEATSNIDNIVNSNESNILEIDRCDVSGKHVSKEYKGLVIIRYSDGSTRKTIIK